MKVLIQAAAVTLIAASTAHGTERLVPEQYPTVAAAIAASSPNDVVSIAPGLYHIDSIGLPSHSLLITGRAAPGQTILTGVGLVVGPGAGVRSISRLTMSGCTAFGAIEVHAASAHIADVVFENCIHGVFATSPSGGSTPAAFIQTTDCTFKSNVRGGYAYINSSWSALRCQFIDNANPGGIGGAASVEGVIGTSSAAFTDCVFIRNSAGRGGALGMRFGGSASFDRCYFERNSASVTGSVSFYEFGGSVSVANGTFCGHSSTDLSGAWSNGGGNLFFPAGCSDCNGDGEYDLGQILIGKLADTDANGIPDICQPATCVDADFFPDRNINGVDLGILLAQWGPKTQYTVADLNLDGVVDGNDLGLFLSFWGPCLY